MATIWAVLAVGAGCFGLGYFVSGHPDDTRAFFTRMRESFAHAIGKKPPPTP